jgi:NAD(P)-dependent dehydrogenase (short-subunit alcohol dehydrogenase family)
MLAALSRGLADRGDQVSVIGRDHSRLEALAASVTGAGAVRPISVDYRDQLDLRHALDDAIRTFGPVTKTVCWVHEEVAPDAAVWIAGQVTGIFVHVLGSASANPARPEILAGWRARMAKANRDLVYRQAVLGFKVGLLGASRWLTNSEISNGVAAALNNTAELTIVGTVTPWSKRP